MSESSVPNMKDTGGARNGLLGPVQEPPEQLRTEGMMALMAIGRRINWRVPGRGGRDLADGGRPGREIVRGTAPKRL